jgi:hypothetical protein
MSLTCDSIQRNLSLFLYGELKIEEEQRIQAHLEKCPDCQSALEKCTAVHHAIDVAETDLPDGLLVAARRGLRERLAAETADRSELGFWQKLSNWMGVPGALLKPAGALAMAALAFYGGRASVRQAEGPIAADPVPMATSVRYVEPDPSGNGVRIALDETRQRTVRGTLEDPKIRQLLLAAAKTSQDPGLRAESVEVLCKRSGESEIRDALIYSVEHDANAAVRLKALDGLKAYASDKQTRQALTRVLLKDANPNVRAMAIDVLTQEGAQDVVAPLQELLRKEDNADVRMRTQTILSQMKASPGVF